MKTSTARKTYIFLIPKTTLYLIMIQINTGESLHTDDSMQTHKSNNKRCIILTLYFSEHVSVLSIWSKSTYLRSNHILQLLWLCTSDRHICWHLKSRKSEVDSECIARLVWLARWVSLRLWSRVSFLCDSIHSVMLEFVVLPDLRSVWECAEQREVDKQDGAACWTAKNETEERQKGRSASRYQNRRVPVFAHLVTGI